MYSQKKALAYVVTIIDRYQGPFKHESVRPPSGEPITMNHHLEWYVQH